MVWRVSISILQRNKRRSMASVLRYTSIYTYVRKVSITREILACNVSNLLSKLNMVWRVSISILQRNKRRSSGKRASIHIDIYVCSKS